MVESLQIEATTPPETRELQIKDIIADEGFMIRNSLDKQVVSQYKDDYETIIQQAPITVYDTPAGLYLVDGFHRINAARQLNKETISAVIKHGSVEDAYAAACLANLRHGKPLSRTEKQKAIKEFIKLHPKWSNVKLATKISCSDETIRRYRKELEAIGEIEPQDTRISKDGQLQPVEINIDDKGSTNVEPSESDLFDSWFYARVIQEDALKILPTLNKRYDLIIVDPPYGITTEDWDLSNRHELLAFTRKWINLAIDCMKPTGRIFIFWSRKYMFELKPNIDELAASYPIEFGGIIVWNYRNVFGMKDNPKQYKLTWEPIFYYYGLDALDLNIFQNTEVTGQDWKGNGDHRGDVWTFAIPQSNFTDKRVHPTQKPLDLYKQIIETTTQPGDKILDPFAGSGTTGHAALLTGRDFLLIEKEPEYIELINDRLMPVWEKGRRKT